LLLGNQNVPLVIPDHIRRWNFFSLSHKWFKGKFHVNLNKYLLANNRINYVALYEDFPFARREFTLFERSNQVVQELIISEDSIKVVFNNGAELCEMLAQLNNPTSRCHIPMGYSAHESRHFIEFLPIPYSNGNKSEETILREVFSNSFDELIAARMKQSVLHKLSAIIDWLYEWHWISADTKKIFDWQFDLKYRPLAYASYQIYYVKCLLPNSQEADFRDTRSIMNYA
jgi:hypothetical protein